ncbi:unnamed protein product [Dimorphilus gyrociliatus]|uniref:AAA+ ATPase domain-containing protein n=1 Tax=Dimorphilus gyrociliatus TaxID=2664684 RepID=A0A7I8VMN2_9ANNE|nr:unnamed protein product [Dimorphilus gyrociliatus]
MCDCHSSVCMENRFMENKNILHIEVFQKLKSLASEDYIEDLVNDYLDNQCSKEFVGNTIDSFDSCPVLKDEIEKISFEGHVFGSRKTYIYSCQTEDPYCEEIEEGIVGTTLYTLPSVQFDNLWDNLIFDSDVKQKLLDMAATTIVLADKGVDSNVVTCNRMLLLHGPPGTGKTSLCKALANKLSIRLKKRFTSAELLEINSHSLFSKWFSESGKLISKTFARLHEIAALDSQTLLIVLIDEVESLAMMRQASSNDPGDSIRAVNALLTQLDQLRRHRNVLVLATSNVTKCIDEAFADRADMKIFIDNPSPASAYNILCSSVEELIRCRILALPNIKYKRFNWFESCNKDTPKYAQMIHRIAHCCQGLSGRTLRKLPIIALSKSRDEIQDASLKIDDFLDELLQTVYLKKKENEKF